MPAREAGTPRDREIWVFREGERLEGTGAPFAPVRLTSPLWAEGRSLFETLLVHPTGRTGLLRAGEHAKRLVDSAGRLGWRGAPGAAELVRWMGEAAAVYRREGDGFGRLRLTVAWMEPDGPPATYITIVPYAPWTRPARVALTPVRLPWSDGAGAVKSGSRLEYARAQALAPAGCDEALLVDEAGRPAEGARSNLFVVAGEALVTPPTEAGILPGVARSAVIALERGSGRPVFERPIELEEFHRAPAAFLTNALWGVRPIASIDSRPLDPAHPMIEAITALWRREAARAIE